MTDSPEIANTKQLMELRQKRSDLEAIWYRQILTLAAGGLALLAGLGPRVPANMGNTGKYFLACTWVFLGMGIIAGSAATYREVSLAKNIAEQFQNQLVQSLREGRQLSPHDLVSASPNKLFLRAKKVMIVSLLLAVCCLVGYSILATLSS